MLARTSPTTAEAWGVSKKLSAEEAARMRSQARHKARRDYNSAIYGAHEEVAQNLLREKKPVEFVAKVTCLPLEEVKRLAASLTD
ncbi:MAG: hypothetical protein LBU79_02795 [Planctomycetota bacterium]|jgi:hypothetical protein|nr:hypothetical protein [Planctomycetota bacterium]